MIFFFKNINKGTKTNCLDELNVFFDKRECSLPEKGKLLSYIYCSLIMFFEYGTIADEFLLSKRIQSVKTVRLSTYNVIFEEYLLAVRQKYHFFL